MQKTMIMRLISVLSATIMLGCVWMDAYVFRSPEKTYAIKIRQPSIDSILGVEISLVSPKGTKQLLRAGETYITFAFVHWSRTRNTVSLLLCGTRKVRIAYKLEDLVEVPFEGEEDDLNESIVRLYGQDATQLGEFKPTDCIGDYYSLKFKRVYKSGVMDGT